MSDDTKTVGVVYRPEVFGVSDVGAAKAIILTPQRGTTTAERWEFETLYLVGRDRARARPRPRSLRARLRLLDRPDREGVDRPPRLPGDGRRHQRADALARARVRGLAARFDIVSRGVLAEIVTTPELAATRYTMRLRKRG